MSAARQYPAELDRLAEIRLFVEDTVASLGGDRLDVHSLVQAVDEAVTNVIMHGYRGQPGWIEVIIEKHAEKWIVCLRDQAPVFDPSLVPPPNLELPLAKRPIGGLGVFLIRQAVDQIIHRPLPDGGNELTLIRQSTASLSQSAGENSPAES